MASDRSLLHLIVYHRYEPRALSAVKEPDGDVYAPHHLYLGLVVLFVGYYAAWPASPVLGLVMMAVGSAIVIDDLLHHAMGATTPIDQFWRWLNRKHIA